LVVALIPLLAGAGWVFLYIWWKQGGAALLGACAGMEFTAFILLLSLLRPPAAV